MLTVGRGRAPGDTAERLRGSRPLCALPDGVYRLLSRGSLFSAYFSSEGLLVWLPYWHWVSTCSPHKGLK